MTTPSSIPTQEVYFPGANFIYGMRMTYVNTTTLTVGQGYCRDSTNSDNISLYLPPNNDQSSNLTPFTLNIAINGAGGLDVGTVAASTLYYVFAIASSTNSQINNSNSEQFSLAVPPFTSPDTTAPIVQDGYYVQATVLMSLSTTPTLPLNYDMYRRIGCVRINASTHIEPFWQTCFGQNRYMRYQTAVAPGTVGTPATSYATIGALLNVIPQVPVEVLIDVSFAANTAADAIYLAPYGNTAGGDLVRMSSPVVTTPYLFQVVCPGEFNAASTPVIEIDYKCTSASDVAVFLIAGYIDAL